MVVDLLQVDALFGYSIEGPHFMGHCMGKKRLYTQASTSPAHFSALSIVFHTTRHVGVSGHIILQQPSEL